ncbi:MAG: site-specific integrase [Clostridiaceae bacterium]|nr:site-specific integrase [Clostridiaceae bacterium]
MPAYKDEKRGTWYCKFYYTDYEGKSRQKCKRGFTLKREAEAWEREFLQNICYQPDMTFSAFYDLYLKDVTPRLRAHTLQRKGYYAKNHLLPSFGEMKLNEISALDVRQWQNELIERDFALKYIQNLHRELSAIFNHAVRFYKLNQNPCRLAGQPMKADEKKPPIRFWTLEEYSKVIDCIDDIKAKTAVSLLYWSGMRKGELLALRWSRIDFGGATVSINESYQRLRGKAVVTPTKTGESRVIRLPDVCMNQLKEYHQCIYDPASNDFVFPWEKRFIELGIREGCKESGVKRIHVHGLRHSHASLLISLGVNVVLISKRLGHAKVSTTLDTYSHFFPDDEETVIDQLDSVILK